MEVIRNHLIALYGGPLGTAAYEALRAQLRPSPENRGRASEGGRQSDSILIAYGDQLREPDRLPLRTLGEFCDQYVRGVHLAPFYPHDNMDIGMLNDSFEHATYNNVSSKPT
jgi:glucosylglycerate phosphorylase